MSTGTAKWAQRRVREQRGTATLQWALMAGAVAALAALSLGGLGGTLDGVLRPVEGGLLQREADTADQEAMAGAEHQQELLGNRKERRPHEEPARARPYPDID